MIWILNRIETAFHSADFSSEKCDSDEWFSDVKKRALALTLLMAWVGADNVDLAPTADDLTVFANSLHTGADFHRRFSRNWTQLVKRTSI